MEELEQNVRDLAAALQAVITAALIAADDPTAALDLLRKANAMAAAIREGEPMPEC